MKCQLSMFDKTHEQLCLSEKQAADALAKARKAHRGQQAAKIIREAIVKAKLKYEIKHNLISTQDRAA